MKRKNSLIFIILIIIAILVFILSLSIGTIKFSFIEVLKGLFVNDDSVVRLIIFNTRFPRILVGGIIGISLGLAGVILQTLMHNRLASPSTIGLTSGASFFGYLILIVFPAFGYLLPFFAIIGCLLTTLIIYFIGYKKNSGPIRIILAGLAISTLFGAFNDLIKTYYSDDLGNAQGFLVGGLNGSTWSTFKLIIPYFIVSLVGICLIPRQLDILLLGDETAKTLGLKINLFRFLIIILVALLVGLSVAAGGLISFVGLIVPHIARLLVGSKHKLLLPCSALLGFILMVFCDFIGRIILPSSEIPVSIILAIIGVPFFLFLLFSKKEVN